MSIVRTDPFPTYDAEEDIRHALDAGASGYLLKDSSQDDLIMPRSRSGGSLANCSGDNASTSATLVNVWAEIRPALLKSSATASGMDHFVTRADWHRWGGMPIRRRGQLLPVRVCEVGGDGASDFA